MTISMTAFARQEAQTEWGVLIWELRSVNHRYLEMQFRLPENFRELEPLLRELLRKKLSRGKVESSLFYRSTNEDSTNLKIDTELLDQLTQILTQVSQRTGTTENINSLELLKWPGVLQTSEVAYDKVKKTAFKLYQDALKQLVDMRKQEGSALAKFIEQRLTSIDKVTTDIRVKIPFVLEQQKQRLISRFEELNISLDPSRIEQELVLLLQKADVEEELDRLETHVKEVKRTLKQSGAVGRRLDFLMQELNREANTLSSKAIDTDITQAAVELKVLIEQMREQIQNIE
ncbi:MAG: YicC family protein [Pseudomonadales bacterium]|nr:YicC family protein [Pseudomonadales bacterium]